jgi:Domain of unknown function (DUF4145)
MFPLRGPEYQPPPPDRDSPPDSRDPGGPCPRCGRTSTFEVLGFLPLTFDKAFRAVNRDGTTELQLSERVIVLQCRGCDQCTAVVEERYVGTRRAVEEIPTGGTINYRGVFWYPPAGVSDLDESIPKQIREAFVEGAKCLAVRAARGAAVMFRRTVEAVVTDKGSPAAQEALERRLSDALQVMADEHTLDPSLASWGKEVRLAGNAGGHFDPLDDVTMEEATELSKLIRNLFLYLYEMPAKLKRQR